MYAMRLQGDIVSGSTGVRESRYLNPPPPEVGNSLLFMSEGFSVNPGFHTEGDPFLFRLYSFFHIIHLCLCLMHIDHPLPFNTPLPYSFCFLPFTDSLVT